MTNNTSSVLPSLLSQILTKTLDDISETKCFGQNHIEGIKALIDSNSLTQDRLVEVLRLSCDGVKNENP